MPRYALLSLPLVLAACGNPVIEDSACTAYGAGPAAMTLAVESRRAETDIRDDIAARMAAGLRAGRAADPGPLGLPRAGTVPVNALAMSTGGQNGAFSSGALAGLPRIPEFQMVTGASAGALVAPVAFAGADYAGLLPLNAGIGDSDVLRRRSFLEIPFQSSLFDTAPLKARMRAAYLGPAPGGGPALIEAVAARAAAGRSLFLGATNLDTGAFVAFDVGQAVRQAETPAGRAACLVDAALASSAIPGAFPPQRIGGALHTDAGVRQHIFVEAFAEALRREERRVQRAGGTLNYRGTLYLIVNDDLAPPAGPTGTNIVNVATRSLGLVTDEGMRASILRTLDAAEAQRLEVRALWIPREVTALCTREARDTRAGSQLFSPVFNRCLFREARAITSEAGFRWRSAKELRRLVEEGRRPR